MAISMIKNDKLVFEVLEATAADVAANSWRDFTYNITKSGYTPLFAVPYGTNDPILVWIGARVDSNTQATATVKNVTSTAATGAHPKIGIIYQKN